MALWLTVALLGFAQCLLLGLMVVPLVRRQSAALGMIDQPNLARKQHGTPIPRSGGLAIFPVFWGCLWLNFIVAGTIVPHLPFVPEELRVLAGNVWLKYGQVMGVFLGATIIFVVGLLDDRFSLSPLVRLAFQVIACLPLIQADVVLKLFLPDQISWLLTILWLVFLTNSFNFLDNMNGLTSGVTVIVCVVMATISALSGEWYMLLLFLMLAGAVAGFWFYNFPKASIFLGDSGSTHAGFLIGAFAVLATYYQEGIPTRLPILIPLIVLGVPLFDTITVMLIRLGEGKPLMQGDTNHISHRLVALGMSRTEAVLFLYGATLAMGLAAIPLRQVDWAHGIVQAALIFLIFFLLHWLERVSYRRKRRLNPP